MNRIKFILLLVIAVNSCEPQYYTQGDTIKIVEGEPAFHKGHRYYIIETAQRPIVHDPDCEKCAEKTKRINEQLIEEIRR